MDSSQSVFKTSLWKCLMAQSKEFLLLHIRLENVKQFLRRLEATNSQWDRRKRFKTTLNLHRSARPTKITPAARCLIVREVTKELRVTAKQLKASHTLPNVYIHKCNIRKTTMYNHGVHGRLVKVKTLLSKKNLSAHVQFGKHHVEKLEDWKEWENAWG